MRNVLVIVERNTRIVVGSSSKCSVFHWIGGLFYFSTNRPIIQAKHAFGMVKQCLMLFANIVSKEAYSNDSLRADKRKTGS